MRVRTIVLLIILQLFASHIYYYRKIVIEDLNWNETIDIDGSNITFIRDKQTGLIGTIVDNYDKLAFAKALGYSHAKDRLSQMNQQRWVAHGRLSECFPANEELKAVDIFIRELGFTKTAKEILNSRISKQNIDYLNAYADGVNYFFKQRNQSLNDLRYFQLLTGAWIGHVVPIESTLIDKCGFEEWKAEDSFVIVALMSYLGLAEIQISAEKFFIQALINDVPKSALSELFPHFEHLSDHFLDLYKSINLSKPFIPHHVPFISSFPKFLASNNWVISPNKSETGYAIQCNDPHLDTSRLPAIWYQFSHQSRSDHRFWFGITVPGFPGFIMGRTKHISFGLTYGFMDMLDYFVEEIKDGKYRVSDEDEWKDLKTRFERIECSDGSITDLLFLETNDGLRTLELDQHLASQLIHQYNPDDHYHHHHHQSGDSGKKYKLNIEDGLYLSRAFSWNDYFNDEHMIAFFPLESTNVLETQSIFRSSPVSANYLIADKAGNIGYQQSGILPSRGNDGLFPLLAWKKEMSWRGVVSPHHLNSVINPPIGYIVTANDDWQNPALHSPVSINLHMGSYRSSRAKEMIQSILDDRDGKQGRLLSVADMKDMQLDNYSKQAEHYFQFLLPILLNNRELLSSRPHHRDGSDSQRGNQESGDDDDDESVFEILKNWDYRYSEDSKAVVLFEEFLKEVYIRVFGRLFGDEVIQSLYSTRISILSVFMNSFDDLILTTKNEELWFGGDNGRSSLFLSILSSLQEKYYHHHHHHHRLQRYSDFHKIKHRNIYFSKTELSYLFGYSIRARAIPGGKQTLNAAAQFTPQNSAESWFCPSWRYITELGSDVVETSLPGGVSARRFSTLYNNLDDYYHYRYQRIEPFFF